MLAESSLLLSLCSGAVMAAEAPLLAEKLFVVTVPPYRMSSPAQLPVHTVVVVNRGAFFVARNEVPIVQAPPHHRAEDHLTFAPRTARPDGRP